MTLQGVTRSATLDGGQRCSVLSSGLVSIAVNLAVSSLTIIGTDAVGSDEPPRTGSSSNLFLVLLALALIDVGYLNLTASKSPRYPAGVS